MANKDKTLDKMALALIVVGGLNWGLKVFDFNIVDTLVTKISQPVVGTIIYALIGLSAVWIAYTRLLK
jgi:uncharacterized protein